MQENSIKKEAWINFLVCFFLGSLGVHKFLNKKIGIGLLYFFTAGLFYVGWIHDWVGYLITALSLTFGNNQANDDETITRKTKKLSLYITIAIVVVFLGSCTALVSSIGNTCTHDIKNATCTEAAVCTLCGENFDKPLGHTWSASTCTAPKTCSVCGTTEGKAMPHTWAEATCTAPKSCTVCKLTEGTPLEHTWNEATCDAPKTCSICKITEGKTLEHKWEKATCKTPQTCSVCKKTMGSTGDHTYVNGKCSICGDKNTTSSGSSPSNSGSSTTSSNISNNNETEEMVWIPTKGGKKYHSHSGCSNMDGPSKVTLSKAKSLGFTACKICH